jgi:hypothetical protein
MSKLNCWEFKKCGREPGGPKVSELGVCPVPLEHRTDSINGGKNGGRSCWAISNSLCGNKVQGNYLDKLTNCMACQFYKHMVREEGMDFVIGTDIAKVLSSASSSRM